MKKIFVFWALTVCVSALFLLSGCGDDDTAVTTGTTAVIETVETYKAIENGGITVELDEDYIRMFLGNFTAEQLRITGDIFDYTLKLSTEEINGVTGCRAEAIPSGATEPESIFFIDGYQCYVFDEEKGSYVSILGNGSASGQNNEEDISDETTDVSENIGAVSDSPVDFQYHDGNNTALQTKFSACDLSALNLPKDLSEYILVVTERTATVTDGKISVIEVYEKDGTLTEYVLGFGSSGLYYFDSSTESYVKL